MAAVSRIRIVASGQLPLSASIVEIGVVPVNSVWVNTQLTFCNTDTVARQVTVHATATSGTAAAASNRIVSAKTLAAGETWTSPDVASQVFSAGMAIKAFADAATVVTYHASTTQMTV